MDRDSWSLSNVCKKLPPVLHRLALLSFPWVGLIFKPALPRRGQGWPRGAPGLQAVSTQTLRMRQNLSPAGASSHPRPGSHGSGFGRMPVFKAGSLARVIWRHDWPYLCGTLPLATGNEASPSWSTWIKGWQTSSPKNISGYLVINFWCQLG